MEFEKWNDLFQYFMINPCDDSSFPLKEVPEQYAVGLRRRFHSFMGECRNNSTSANNPMIFPMTAADLIDKLIDLRGHYFIQQGTEYLQKSSNKPIEEIGNKNHIKFLNYQLEYYDKVINYLHKKCIPEHKTEELKKTTNTPSSWKRSLKYSGFSTKLASTQINELFNELKHSNFISEDTDLKNFINIFQGISPSKKIKWLGNNNELSYFIRQIYKATLNPPKDIWEVTLNCFCNENGEEFKKVQLRYTANPKSTYKIDQIAETILND